jgi:hypothetical protein
LIIALDLNKLLDNIPRVENTMLGKILLEIFKNIRHKIIATKQSWRGNQTIITCLKIA